MFKLLLLVLGVWIVWVILKSRRPPSAEKVSEGTMVRCDVCGVHLPEKEAIASQDRHYCCEAHFLERKPT